MWSFVESHIPCKMCRVTANDFFFHCTRVCGARTTFKHLTSGINFIKLHYFRLKNGISSFSWNEMYLMWSRLSVFLANQFEVWLTCHSTCRSSMQYQNDFGRLRFNRFIKISSANQNRTSFSYWSQKQLPIHHQISLFSEEKKNQIIWFVQINLTH